MYETLDSYPGDAIGGADFLSGAAQRTIVGIDKDGREQLRLERIVVTDRYFDAEDVAPLGRACFSEQTIRTMGAVVGLVDEVTHERALAANRALRRTLDDLTDENIRLKSLIAAWEGTEAIREWYVTADGAKHATLAAAKEHNRAAFSEADQSLQEATP